MFDVIVVTPEKVLFEGKADSAILPGENGVFEVMSFHKPILSRLISGEIEIDEQFLAIRRGIAKVEDNVLTAIVEIVEEDA